MRVQQRDLTERWVVCGGGGRLAAEGWRYHGAVALWWPSGDAAGSTWLWANPAGPGGWAMARTWLPESRAQRGWDDLQNRPLGPGSALAARSGEASGLEPGKSLEAKAPRFTTTPGGALRWVQAAAGGGSLPPAAPGGGGGSTARAGHGRACSGSMVAPVAACVGDAGWAPTFGAPQACASI